MQHVMQTLGDREELRICAQHPPTSVDPCAAPVGKQGLKHLRDATALGCRVHVPNDPAVEQLAGPPRPPPRGRSLSLPTRPCVGPVARPPPRRLGAVPPARTSAVAPAAARGP